MWFIYVLQLRLYLVIVLKMFTWNIRIVVFIIFTLYLGQFWMILHWLRETDSDQIYNFVIPWILTNCHDFLQKCSRERSWNSRAYEERLLRRQFWFIKWKTQNKSTKINTDPEKRHQILKHSSFIYAHTKPSGTFLPHPLTSKLRATGTSSFTTPSTFALIAVHKHNAASRSARPFTTVQHSSLGGVPTISVTNPSQLPQTPNLRVSFGHLAGFSGVKGGLFGVHGMLQDETMVKNMTLSRMKQAAAAFQPLKKPPILSYNKLEAGSNSHLVWIGGGGGSVQPILYSKRHSRLTSMSK